MASAFQPRVLVTVTASDARTVAVAGRTPVGTALDSTTVSVLQVRVQNRSPVALQVHNVDRG